MKSKKNTSPVRSRDKVLQSLYEIELGGSTAEEILEDKIIQKISYLIDLKDSDPSFLASSNCDITKSLSDRAKAILASNSKLLD